MGLDIRLPIGALFTLLGGILVAYGLIGDASIYQRSLGYNVNFWWGLALVLFGLVMLYLGRRGGGTSRLAELDPEGREIEARELREGLERDNPAAHRK